MYANKDPDDFLAGALHSLDDPANFNQPRIGGPALGSMSPALMAKNMGIELANTVKMFEAFFGPYPYKHLAITSIAYTYGQGWPTLIYLSSLSFLDSSQRNQMGITNQIELTDAWRGHESSHQWWGHRVGWKTYHDQWLSEGFAEFSGNLYAQIRQNSNVEYLRLIRDQRDLLLLRGNLNGIRYESLGPIWMGSRLSTSDSRAAYRVVIYEKGGLFLHTLRMMLSEPSSKEADRRFMNMMQDFTKTFDNKPASTEDFKAIAEKHMTQSMDIDGNQKLDWMFDQYVYGTGIPRYSLHYEMTPAAEGKTRVTGTLTREFVPPSWKDILALYGEVGGKKIRMGWLTATEPETKLDFMIPSQVSKLLLNVNEDTLVLVK